MSYVLDGIKTAYTVTEHLNHERVPYLECPCGFHEVDSQTLRFHFNHCPQARIPGLERDESVDSEA